MKILALSGWFPIPPDNGARMRVHYLLHELGCRHQVDLVSFVRPEEHPEQMSREHPWRLIGTAAHKPFQPQGVHGVLGLLSSQPRSVKETFSPQMASLVERAIRETRYDLALAFEVGPGGSTAHYVPAAATLPVVIEDLELAMIYSAIAAQEGAARQLRQRLTWWKTQRYAAYLLHRAAAYTTCSESERELVARCAPRDMPLAVVPNGISMSRYEGDWGPQEPDTLVFPGALTYQANYDAMRFFLEESYPRIRAERPNTMLRITGRTAGVDLRRLRLDASVELTGYVEDVRPVIARSAVCIVPLTWGGGTRLKVLEALALGAPVVATTIGAQGIAVTPERDILLADDAQSFAAAVLRLLNDANLSAELAQNGRRLVRANYDWCEIGRKLNDFVGTIVQEFGR